MSNTPNSRFAGVAGYFTDGDGYRHAIVAASALAAMTVLITAGCCCLRPTGTHFEPFVNVVRQFHADPSGANDSSGAFIAAIDSLGANGGTIEVPAGEYFFTNTVVLTNHCVIRGAGAGDGFNAGTRIMAEKGVTAFRVGGEQGSAWGSILEKLCVVAKGTYSAGEIATATYNWDSDQTTFTAKLILTSPYTSWSKGQLIALRGMGPWVNLDNVTAGPAPSSQQLTISLPPGLTTHPGIFEHGYYVVQNVGSPSADVYQAPTECVDTTQFPIISMAHPLNNPVSARASVWFATDILARITDTANNNTILYIDWTVPPDMGGMGDQPDRTGLYIQQAGPPVHIATKTDITIEHADAAVDILTKCSVQNCVIGSAGDPGDGFQGPGIAIRGNSNPGIPTMTNAIANDWCVFDTDVLRCRNALYLQGNNSSGGMACRVRSKSRQWAFVNLGQYGNPYLACHAEGDTAGWLTREGLSDVLLGCYIDGNVPGSRLGSNGITIPAMGSYLGKPAQWLGGLSQGASWHGLINLVQTTDMVTSDARAAARYGDAVQDSGGGLYVYMNGVWFGAQQTRVDSRENLTRRVRGLRDR